ncbi:2-dehydropantoate 2-reductase [Streptomyces paromomycinus]|uniref:2-dehydropantoate 2-reductase n=1 Tax=Streptomyces paromomycinus TaxID=92743 RepID=A0A401W8M4_STREY|nr:2-dehydropantoate 2-reductase [Streptomyces paromomycinus]GCD45665.1 putative 2-dehydropantoate 2-reductase [Streptomyces paromomycinus]
MPPTPVPAEPVRIAVIGGGAIGGFVAALTHLTGHDVTLCLRTPVDRLALETDGEVIDAPVRFAVDPQTAEPADWVFLATKAQDTAGAAGWLRRLCRSGTVVAVLQNGINHTERVAPHTPDGTDILPAVVYASVECTAPGRVRHYAGNEIHVPEGALATRLAGLLTAGRLKVVPVPDFTTVSWQKLLANLAANPLTALLQQRMGIFTDPGMAALARDILSEAAAVARAEGADVHDADIDRVLMMYGMVPPDGGSSMLYDRLAGRPLEHEHITGAVVRAGERHGIRTPLNGMLLTLLRAVDREITTAGKNAGERHAKP